MSPLAYDAVLLLGFGGPAGPDDVMPFLERVTAGRRVPRARLEEVAEHYYAVGGVSPITAQSAGLLESVRTRLVALGLDVPCRLAHRNSAPYADEVLAELAGLGARRVLGFAASAFPSYSGCRQYREDLALGAAACGAGVEVVKVAPFVDVPGLAEAQTDLLTSALRTAGPDAVVLFSTHSLPVGPAASSGPSGDGYVTAHLALAASVVTAAAARLGRPEPRWQLVYQSRSGPPQVPWLEPDVNDAIRAVAAAGDHHVVLVPLGFLTDHMEVVWDLDHEAAATAVEVGVELTRVATVGDHAAFLDGLAARLAAHLRGTAETTTFCGAGCCRTDDPRPTVEGV